MVLESISFGAQITGGVVIAIIGSTLLKKDQKGYFSHTHLIHRNSVFLILLHGTFPASTRINPMAGHGTSNPDYEASVAELVVAFSLPTPVVAVPETTLEKIQAFLSSYLVELSGLGYMYCPPGMNRITQAWVVKWLFQCHSRCTGGVHFEISYVAIKTAFCN